MLSGPNLYFFGKQGPIALYGFFVAATWIDAIADHLVKLLQLLGIVCHIPASIMGLTLLAWGNSMGDLSANLTMARKGLANMAMTACFAGPVFNMLVGLGGGFMALSKRQETSDFPVELSSDLYIGFSFLQFNCLIVLLGGSVFNPGKITKSVAQAGLALYIFYIVTCLVVRFS